MSYVFKDCKTTYYHNYYVHSNAATRTFYPQIPKFLQIATHYFVTPDVCEMFANMMTFSCTVLEVPNDSSTQFDRLLPAIQRRNIAMVGPGQPEWNHACDLCCYITADSDNQPVTDGISIGHPCCAVHDCPHPIRTQKGSRYCAHECSVIACGLRASPGFRTCAEPAHRALDEYLRLENRAMFQLRRRLEQLHPGSKSTSTAPSTILSPSQLGRLINTPAQSTGDTSVPVSAPDDSAPSDSTLLGELESLLDNATSPAGNKQHRAQFGRRRTHNEEVAVASCGVILGRATFYGSEAINGVLGADADTRAHFSHCVLPVDVFHFKCKHKESDVVCGTHCNPYIWPELRTEKGAWRFNSSAAEQANVWLDKFQPIVREMQVDRYNFFLDERVRGLTK
ncbi:uncharacterized protein TRAVEDRAFT_39313 [Trametes versicolor FP-101664 SS1]|uniref:uncharacterized protein n=1 Tax=Trametes versicolor (strain FP-101664) TaxID=717944 RepID=UPI0004622D3F|nr:uncharacterized protein TRAVEDRAFT_39313 [Trametes versicolor FP-101664 SS1]EIW54821.1 hypothetical protein TRAVEDRAFT_39313 [Trametes versicolor FP-101664 SS1]